MCCRITYFFKKTNNMLSIYSDFIHYKKVIKESGYIIFFYLKTYFLTYFHLHNLKNTFITLKK